MRAADSDRRYRGGEEIANSIIHGTGALAAVAGLVVLVAAAAATDDGWRIVSAAIYGATLILLYTASTLYHGIAHPRARRVLRFIDHAAIFLLIAGTYTPFTLVSLRGPWGWSLFGVIWGLALTGITAQSRLLHRWTALSLALYVAMGWAAVVAVRPLLDAVAPGGLLLLLLGGIAYTAGIGFYVWRRLPYHHAVWHGFVLAGSACHYFAILGFVIPAG
ncbi:MAG TPA: hemolysin III family protein [Acidobacteriota bacterium]|nr:hemolysin III family protein [Acidobacteriota bacterium]HOT00304.1 hemolysin III family protein [Acidobacteriota bacterium]HQF85978.1 hemolysin III family protein [Acidobacteriota bacterium]HQG90779.1 hemolysin III family protein [Acidobacteriota bacterium]HQK86692.1 hemolysin III family protein [Acidobacteriota bacterium]